jgi:hypothetical protein
MVKKGHPESCQMEETNSSSEIHEDCGYVYLFCAYRTVLYCGIFSQGE